jgi:hypothetical protein
MKTSKPVEIDFSKLDLPTDAEIRKETQQVKRSLTMKAKFESDEFREKHSNGRKKLKENSDWLQNIKEAGKKRAQNPNWLKQMKQQAMDPIHQAKQKAGAERMAKDSTWYNKASQAVRESNRKPVSVFDQFYSSRTAAAKAIGIDVTSLAAWMKKYPDQIFYVNKDPGMVYCDDKPIPVTIDGVVYPSRQAAADAFGISLQSVSKKIAGQMNTKQLSVDGTVYNSISECTANLGVNRSTIFNWLKKRPDRVFYIN